MKDFLFNILPRIKAYSKELDITENIIDKPWIWISDEGINQKLVFRREGVLLMINNGDVKTGTWEYIPALNSFLIDRTIDKLLMNHQFLNESVMLLKQDGANSGEILPFVNELNIPSLDYVKYLTDLGNDPIKIKYARDQGNNVIDVEGKRYFKLWSLDNREISVYSTNANYGVEPNSQDIIYTESGILSDGYYTLSDDAYNTIPKEVRLGRKVYYIREGILDEAFNLDFFRTKYKGRPVNIYYKYLGILQDSAVLYADTFEEITDLKFSCALMTVLTVKNGRVIHKSMF